MIVAIIPARSGSKGVPNKNIVEVGGHPLIAYSVAAAEGAETIDRVIVSTDSAEYADTARRYGAEVPFLRPESLSGDDAHDLPVLEHALDFLAEEDGTDPVVLVQVRPTSFLRPRGLLDEAVRRLLADETADCVRSITESRPSAYKMWRLDGEGAMVPLLESKFAEPYNMLRQELPMTYAQTGHVDAIRVTTIREKHSLCGDRILPIHVDPKYSVDIDTAEDIEISKWIIENRDLDIEQPRRVAS